MPNDTSFAIKYKKLIDHNFEPEPERAARARRDLIALIAACTPPPPEKQLWTKTNKYDTISNADGTGEEMK